MTGIKVYDQFALSCAMPESARLLLGFTLRRVKGNKPTEIELNLRTFNREIGKIRDKGEFHRRTLGRAINYLNENSMGAVTIIKKYSFWEYKILVRPLEFLPKHQSAKCASSPKLNPGNPMFSEAHKNRLALQQQQDISKLDFLLKKVGLNYTSDNLLKIWRMAGKSWSEITGAIEYMLYANSSQVEGVTKPHGWLINSLKYGWHKAFDLLYSVELPKFDSVRDIASYVDNLLRDRDVGYET